MKSRANRDAVLDIEYMFDLLERGVYIRFDDFGKEFSLDIGVGPSSGSSLRVVPLQTQGISEENIDALIRGNPKRLPDSNVSF